MDQARVVINSPIGNVPDFMKDPDGKISFDVSPETKIALSKAIDDYSNPGILKQDAIKTIDLPFTKKNQAILGAFGNPTAFNFNHFQSFRVGIYWGNFTMQSLESRILKVTSKGWTISIRAEDFNWIGKLNDLKLQDVDLGSITFTQAWLDDNHINRWTYSDGDDGVFTPLVNYGKWRLKEEATDTNLVAPEDYRFWFSPLHLLRKAFCHIGWKFICPFLEGDFGRRWWTYILSPTWNELDIDPIQRGFRAQLTSSQFPPSDSVFRKVEIDDDSTSPNFDTNGHFNTSTFEYTGAGVMSFSLNIKVTNNITGNANTTRGFRVRIVLEDAVGNKITLKDAGGRFTYANEFNINLETDDIYVYSNEKVYVDFAQSADNFLVEIFEATFSNKVKAATIQLGDTINLASLIHPDYTALQYLKGIAHIVNMKYETNTALKTVEFYPAQDATIYYDEEVEGYFRPTTKSHFDLTRKIQQNFEQITIKERTQKRLYTLAFKENTNDYNINQLNLDKPFLSKTVDFGEQFNEGEELNRNPFFVPTININDTKITRTKQISRAPYIPALWDGEPEDGEYPDNTNNIAPRICFALPYDYITKLSDFSEMFGQLGGDRVEFEKSDGVTQQEMSLFAQILPMYIFPEQNPYFSDNSVNEAIAYGTNQVRTDLQGTYDYFFKKAIKDYYYGFTIRLLVHLEINDIANFSFRDMLKIEHHFKQFGTKTFYARAVDILDFVIGEYLTTPVVMLPEVTVFDVDC